MVFMESVFSLVNFDNAESLNKRKRIGDYSLSSVLIKEHSIALASSLRGCRGCVFIINNLNKLK